MNLSTPPPDEVICNTTPTRIFALVDQVDLLAHACGGEILVPRPVLDDDDDPDGPPEMLSEIGKAELYWASRSTAADAIECWFRLGALRTRTDITIVDLTYAELVRFAELQSRDIQRRFNLAARLGPGEAAVMAIAAERNWTAAIDDAEARTVLHELSPSIGIATTRELIRRSVYSEHIDTGEADAIYDNMLDRGYRGPPLWA